MIADLLAVRWLSDPQDEPVALSAPFLAKWSGTDENLMRRGKYWLEQHGYIEHVADLDVGKAKPLYLWAVARDSEGWSR